MRTSLRDVVIYCRMAERILTRREDKQLSLGRRPRPVSPESSRPWSDIFCTRGTRECNSRRMQLSCSAGDTAAGK